MRSHADIYVVGISNGGDDQDRLLSRRLAGTLERGGFSCTGEHEGDENEPGRVNIAETECRCVFFVVSPGAPVDAAVVAQLRAAAAAGRATRCIYEAGNSACQDVSEWGSAMPMSFLRPAVPISRYFPRTSEKLVLAAAAEELLRAPPRQVDADGQADFVRGFPADPGGRFAAETRRFQSLMAGEEGQDHSDFAQLANLTCIQWLQARDLQLVFGADDSAETLRSILEEKSSPAVSSAIMLLGAAYRPIYVSFLPGDLRSMPVCAAQSHVTTPLSRLTGQTPYGHTPHCQTPKSSASFSGPLSCAVPSENQLILLEKALESLPGGCTDSVAVGFCVVKGIEGPGMPEVLLASHIAVLEGPGSNSLEEHLMRGESFIEVVIAIVTGRLVPCRPNQLPELDAAVGRELEPGAGATLTELVDADAEGSGNLINKICAFVQAKDFSSCEARAWWTRHCRRALETHPLLQGRAYRRTLLQNCVSTDSLSIASTFHFGAQDLINNECANALADTGLKVRVVSEAPTEMKPGDENTETGTLDWGEQVNQTRLKDLRKLMRCLFQAFDADDPQMIKGNQAGSFSSRRYRFTRWTCLNFLNSMVHSDIFAITFAVLTIYTLFAPNILLVFGLSTEYTPVVAILNTVVLCFFALECMLSCFFVNGYMRSGRVFLDVMAMVSLAGDTLVWAHLFPSQLNGATTAQPVDFRATGFTGRSDRLLDILKFARLFRIVQLLRTLHGIVWRNFLRPHHGLAQQLYHKRLWRVFQDLDEGKKGKLSTEQMNFFFMAMRLEFPERKVGMSKSKVFRSNVTMASSHGAAAFASRQYGTMMSLKPAALSRLSHFAPSWDLHPKTDCDGTFASIIDEFNVRPEGKRALTKCQEDVQRVKASFSLVQKVSGPVVVKVCLIVLGVMGIVILLDASVEDHGDYQHLAHLDHLAASMEHAASGSCSVFCDAVEDFVKASPHVTKMAGIRQVYWTETSCECSNPPSRWLEVAKEAALTEEHQPHELQLVCYPNEDCTGTVTSVALMNIHESVREYAQADLVYTLIVVVLMVIFALAFMHALNKVNTRMLHPLWNILDDMASLRSLEAVRMTNFQPASNMLKDLQHSGKKRSTCRRLLRYSKRSGQWACESKKEDDVKELADLRLSLSTMRAALRSWAKYVPPYLLKSLYRSGVEATVGFHENEVSILFCDIDGFREMCRDRSPKEVLTLLSLVHGEVSNAIEAQAGTLLEFVGDEVLAVFNAPNEVVDHEEHAVESATDVLERADRLGVRMRCGVHSGKVLVGNIGSQTRIKYGVLGDSVNVAARLKSLNSHWGTCCLVSDESLEEADDLHKSYVARPVGNLVLKGRKSPTKVWEVRARRQSSSQTLAKTYDAHRRAFELFIARRFGEARPLLAEVCRSLKGRMGSVDIPSQHLLHLCDKYLKEPPPDDWDGSESMSKK